MLQFDAHTFTYLRSDMHQRVLVALNKSDRQQSVQVALPAFYDETHAIDLLNNTREAISNRRMDIAVPPYGYRILRLQRERPRAGR